MPAISSARSRSICPIPGAISSHLGDVVTLLNKEVVVLEADLAVASGASVGVRDGLQEVVEAEGLDLRDKPVREDPGKERESRTST